MAWEMNARGVRCGAARRVWHERQMKLVRWGRVGDIAGADGGGPRAVPPKGVEAVTVELFV